MSLTRASFILYVMQVLNLRSYSFNEEGHDHDQGALVGGQMDSRIRYMKNSHWTCFESVWLLLNYVFRPSFPFSFQFLVLNSYSIIIYPYILSGSFLIKMLYMYVSYWLREHKLHGCSWVRFGWVLVRPAIWLV